MKTYVTYRIYKAFGDKWIPVNDCASEPAAYAVFNARQYHAGNYALVKTIHNAGHTVKRILATTNGVEYHENH